MNIPVTDLTQRPPRSVRVRLGGYALLPRMLDKCRAELAGTPGSFHYACPNDQRILGFLGIDADALKTEVAKGNGDGEVLAWITANREPRHLGQRCFGKTPPELAYRIVQFAAKKFLDEQARQLLTKL